MSTTPTATSSPRLVPLTASRLVGNGLFRFVYPYLAVVAVDVGLDAGSETLLITGLAAGGMVLPAVSKWLLDDTDAPRRSTTAGLVTLFVGAVLLGGVAPLVADVLGWLGAGVALFATVLLGLGKPLLDVGSMTYVSARVDWRGRGRAISVMELTWAGGLLVLGAVAPLAAAIGWQAVLIGLGVIALAVAPLLRRELEPDEVTADLDDAGAAVPTTSRGTTDAATLRRSSLLFLVAFAFVFVALEVTFGVISLWLEDVRGVTGALVASLTAIGGVGEFAGALLTTAAADRVGKARMSMLGLLGCAAGFGLLGIAGPLWLALAGMVLGLFGTEVAIVAGLALASEVDPRRRTAFLSRAIAVSSVARAIAGGGSALLLRRVGISLNTGISVAAALLGIAALVALVRSDQRLRG